MPPVVQVDPGWTFGGISSAGTWVPLSQYLPLQKDPFVGYFREWRECIGQKPVPSGSYWDFRSWGSAPSSSSPFIVVIIDIIIILSQGGWLSVGVAHPLCVAVPLCCVKHATVLCRSWPRRSISFGEPGWLVWSDHLSFDIGWENHWP